MEQASAASLVQPNSNLANISGIEQPAGRSYPDALGKLIDQKSLEKIFGELEEDIWD